MIRLRSSELRLLRKARVDGETITHAAAELGLSRVAFYKALIAFEDSGLAGLLPHKRGPRQGHKLTDEVIDFLRAALTADASLDAAADPPVEAAGHVIGVDHVVQVRGGLVPETPVEGGLGPAGPTVEMAAARIHWHTALVSLTLPLRSPEL